jgi:hypothetical protein
MAYTYKKGTAWWLFVRSLEPSYASIGSCLLLTVVIVACHLLFLSSQADLLLPHFAGEVNGQLEAIYAVRVLRPINDAFGNSVLSTLTTALVWGLVGWVIYAVLDAVASTRRDLQSRRHEISIPQKGQVIYHPIFSQVVFQVLWHFFIGLIFVGSTVALLPILGNLLKHDVYLLQAEGTLAMLRQMGIVVVGWALILHYYVILFRLFVLRTRVFGEILY